MLKNGRYDNMPIETVTSTKKVVNVKEHYSVERLRPVYQSFEMKPLFLMTSELIVSAWEHSAECQCGRVISCQHIHSAL